MFEEDLQEGEWASRRAGAGGPIHDTVFRKLITLISRDTRDGRGAYANKVRASTSPLSLSFLLLVGMFYCLLVTPHVCKTRPMPQK